MNASLSLIEPCADLKEAYVSLVLEFLTYNEPLIPFPLKYPYDDFDSLIRKLSEHSRNIGLPEGFVANSTFWLVSEERELLGVSNLRHKLTPSLKREGGHIGYGVRPSQRGKGYASALLKMTLEKAKARGLDRVLLTCGKGNIASARVILKNGGKYESEEYLEDRGEIVQRYWINLTD